MKGNYKMEKTIKIESYFGEKDFTKEEFVKRWTSWSVDFGNLCTDSEDWEQYKKLQTLTKQMAEKSFDRELKKEGIKNGTNN